jgi:protein involved in polysaccharide export with SLBB domain
MKSKLLLLLAAILLVASLHGVFAVDENQYILKAGDMMLIQVMSADTIDIQTPVLPEGRVSIYPFGEPVPVAGLTLHEGRERLAAAIRTAVPKSMVTAELMAMAPMSIHVTGAVKIPANIPPKHSSRCIRRCNWPKACCRGPAARCALREAT